MIERFGRNGKKESAEGFPTEDQQRARIRISALKLEHDLTARVRAGERGLQKKVEEVQATIQSLGREPGMNESTTLADHWAMLTAALASPPEDEERTA